MSGRLHVNGPVGGARACGRSDGHAGVAAPVEGDVVRSGRSVWSVRPVRACLAVRTSPAAFPHLRSAFPCLSALHVGYNGLPAATLALGRTSNDTNRRSDLRKRCPQAGPALAAQGARKGPGHDPHGNNRGRANSGGHSLCGPATNRVGRPGPRQALATACGPTPQRWPS
jgi:hypothetical protein